jgi:glycosyltransferase involved in cell wall biosynthesis
MSVVITSHPTNKKDDNALFSIIIPSWNNLSLLRICVESIMKNSAFKHQIIVHINEGSDGTENWVKERGYDYTFSAENAGVCYALNAAAALATTNYILYINDDMYVCPKWDKFLWEEIQNIGHNHFFLSATMIEPVAGNPASIAPHNYGTISENFDEGKLLKEYNSFTHQDWSGSAWPPNVVHKSMWNMVGGYSIEFSPGFYSDPDFCMKLWKAGVRLFKGVSSSRVYHFRSKSTARVKANNGRKTFASKWGFPASYFYREVLHLGLPFSGPLSEFEPHALAKVKALWQRLK